MKTTISADGTLTIKPETELEAFALRQWGKISFSNTTDTGPCQFTGRLVIDGALDTKSAVTPYSGQLRHAEVVLSHMCNTFKNVIGTHIQPFSLGVIKDSLRLAASLTVRESIRPEGYQIYNSALPADVCGQMSDKAADLISHSFPPPFTFKQVESILNDAMRSVLDEYELDD